jgi:hypothetical protein
MKKIFVVLLYTYFSTITFAQSDIPTETEIATVIEGYFRCIGNGDIENLSKYAMKEFVDDGVLLINTALNETQRTALKNYKIKILKVEKLNENTFFCYYTDNNIFYNGGGPLTVTLTRENIILKMTR